MITEFQKVFSIYADQIASILINKDQMWSMGFRNGLITYGPSFQQSYTSLTHNPSDYELGYREGHNFSLYKLSLHNKQEEERYNIEKSKAEERLKQEEELKKKVVKPHIRPASISENDITVGYVVQSYDFSFCGLEKTSLAERHTSLIDILYEGNQSYNASVSTLEALLSEEEKILDMISYLRVSAVD